MNENKKITLNIVATVVNFAITTFIGLVITPYIVKQLGGEAYGFVGLANNFVSYATLITIALNAMASRFVSIELFKKDYVEANRYFTSVFFANLILTIILLPILTVVVWKLEAFIEIPPHLLLDVKTAFAIVFFQFVLNILLSRFEIATFVANKLYLEQRNQIISNIIRLGCILVCFFAFSTRITYLTLGSLLGAMFIYCMNIYYTRKFIPQLRIKRDYFQFKYVKTLLSSGIWSLINKLSSVLMDGFDLLISNMFIGATEMGLLALSKTVPAMFMNLRGTLDYPFTPPMTKCYANNDIDGVVKYARMGNKVLGIFLIAPMATFTTFGVPFFDLWVPSQDSNALFWLSILANLSLIASACINSVFSIFTITNKLRAHSIVVFITAILTLVTNFILLKTTKLGIYAIAGVSSCYSLLRNYVFTPLYGAYCLKVRKSTFYHEIITGNICLVLNLIVGWILQHILVADSWLTLIFSAGVMVSICICINFFFVLTKNERNIVWTAIRAKVSTQ